MSADLRHPGMVEDLKSLRLPRFAAAPRTGPFVVAIEGPNGAGKTTLAANISKSMGVPSCLGIDEAWFSEPFKVRMIRDAEWHASAMFFFSGCFEQTRLLERRKESVMIMDRSLWSTLAVHAAEKIERLRLLLQMIEPVSDLIVQPHLTVVLEASFPTCLSRIAAKSGVARALDELTANTVFHGRETEFYRWLAGQVPTVSFLDVDSASPEDVARAAVSLIRSKLC
jgi:thymidylate kinase